MGSCQTPSMLTLTHHELNNKEGEHAVGEVAGLSLLSIQIVNSVGGFVRKGKRNAHGSNITTGHNI